MALIIGRKNFEEEVLKSEVPVLVDFYADWCGHCKIMGPIVEQIEQEMQGKAKVGKVDVDESRDLAMKYNIMTVPTFLIFKQGTLIETVVGAVAKEELINKLDS